MRRKTIPHFKSEKEEALFWETHSPLDYPAQVGDIEDPFAFSPALLKKIAARKKERKQSLTIRIEQQQIALAKIIAGQKGLGYQTQMRMWIREGIHKELQEHPEIKKRIRAAA